MLLRVLECATLVIMFAFMLTQVIVPIWNGTIMFPFFRSKANELSKEIAMAKDEAVVADMALEVKALNEKTKTKRRTKVSIQNKEIY